MMNQVLARKYRPKDFDHIIGQGSTVRALMNALNTQHLHHAYLFTGTRGVGKTTIARVLAKCLNCAKGISAKPCDQCTNCQEIDKGCFPDLYEVDAASRTKVEDTRLLLDNVPYAPTKGRYKIYLIDEIHMLSGHSFNALLKTLEEPPEHVKFLLATTDYHKLPATILSRCLQFHLSLIPPDHIAKHLEQVLKQENVAYDTSALMRLGFAANGSVRDALSLLDQSIAYGNGTVLDKDIKTMLGTSEPTTLIAILQTLQNQDGHQLLQHIATFNEQGVDFSQVLADLLGLLHQIAIIQAVPDAKTHPVSDEIRALAASMEPEDTQLFYQIGLIGQRDLPFAPTSRTGFEMTLLRMMTFYPQTNHQQQPNKSKHNVHAKKASTHTKPTNKVTLANWHTVLPHLQLSGAARALAEQCILQESTETTVTLALSANKKPLNQPKQVQRINQALSQYLNRNVTVTITIDTHTEKTPAEINSQSQDDRRTATKAALMKDRKVQQIIQKLDATLIEDSISTLKTDETQEEKI